MPYVPGTAGDQPIRVGLEHLNDVDLAALERIGVLRHGRVRRAAERGGIDSGAVEVVEERHPGGRHVHRDRDPRPDQIPEAKFGVGRAAHQHERVAGDDLSDDDYLEGAPELIVEVAASSASIDMHAKRSVYRRNGVQEYIVWRTRENRLDWFELLDGEYRPLPSDRSGVVRSRVFPGLRLAVNALLEGNLAAALAELERGLQSPEHRDFVSRLAE